MQNVLRLGVLLVVLLMMIGGTALAAPGDPLTQQGWILISWAPSSGSTQPGLSMSFSPDPATSSPVNCDSGGVTYNNLWILLESHPSFTLNLDMVEWGFGHGYYVTLVGTECGHNGIFHQVDQVKVAGYAGR